MAWSTIPDTDIDPESPVTTPLMTALRDNPIAIAGGLSGAPQVVQAAIANSAVGQAQLKTTTASGSVAVGSNSHGSFTLTGGAYSWWTMGAGQDLAGVAMVIGQGDTAAGVIGLTNYDSSSVTAYFDERYFQASPPYDLGDGEIPLFVSLLIDSRTLEVLGYSVAPDPVWAYNGPTDIRTAKVIDDVHYRVRKKVPCTALQAMGDKKLFAAYMESLEEPEYEIEEITQAVKNADMDIVPHPFGTLQKDRHVVMLDPVSDLCQMLRCHHDEVSCGGNLEDKVGELIVAGKVKFKTDPLSRNGPKGVAVVEPYWALTNRR